MSQQLKSPMSLPHNRHARYHAHVYFDDNSREQAAALRATISQTLNLPVGRFNLDKVGPHPTGSFETAFSQAQFELFVPWIAEHRQALPVLIHPLTDNELRDHTDDAHWLGSPLPLDLSIFANS